MKENLTTGATTPQPSSSCANAAMPSNQSCNLGTCPPAVNGQCGANTNSCSVGTLNGPYTSSGTSYWDCLGTNGASNASCSCTPNWQTASTGTCSATCGGGTQTATQSDGCGGTQTITQTCNTQACACTPNWVTTSTGACSATCGGGTQSVTQSDGCGNTRTISQSCNTGVCANYCGLPWGYGYYPQGSSPVPYCTGGYSPTNVTGRMEKGSITHVLSYDCGPTSCSYRWEHLCGKYKC
ncbi:MAG: hypothetical protein KGI97_04650 [Alphaproteobacteria bacterium]|nr:hypothetical protein [Alphaproteobacteria bacterium]